MRRARSSRTARRSTATRGWRSSGRRSRRSSWSASARTPTSSCATSRTPTPNALERPGRRRAVHLDLLLPAGPSGQDVASPQLYVPPWGGRSTSPSVQGRDPRLLGPGLPHEDRRGARDRHVAIRVTPKTLGEYPVVCAELCGLGHAAMRQIRARCPREEFDRWLPSGAAAAGGRRGGRRGRRRRRRRPTARRSSPTAGCGGCVPRSPTRGRPADRPRPRRGPRGQGRGVHPRGDRRTPRPRSQGFQPGIMPANFGETLQPAELDALVEYLDEVAGR